MVERCHQLRRCRSSGNSHRCSVSKRSARKYKKRSEGMACSSAVKLNTAASSWIAGHHSVNNRQGSTVWLLAHRASVVRAGSYTDEIIKTALIQNFSIQGVV